MVSTWREDLRLLDELQLDELHKACARRCAEVSGLTSAGTLRPLASRGLRLEALREVELRAKAKEGLREIAAAFLSADFQVPCKLAGRWCARRAVRWPCRRGAGDLKVNWLSEGT